jgi:hypothetical protein
MEKEINEPKSNSEELQKVTLRRDRRFVECRIKKLSTSFVCTFSARIQNTFLGFKDSSRKLTPNTNRDGEKEISFSFVFLIGCKHSKKTKGFPNSPSSSYKKWKFVYLFGKIGRWRRTRVWNGNGGEGLRWRWSERMKH